MEKHNKGNRTANRGHGPEKGAPNAGRAPLLGEKKQNRTFRITDQTYSFIKEELGGTNGLELLIRGEHDRFMLVEM